MFIISSIYLILNNIDTYILNNIIMFGIIIIIIIITQMVHNNMIVA